MRSCPYANVKQNFPKVPDFLSGARCAVFLLSVVWQQKYPAVLRKRMFQPEVQWFAVSQLGALPLPSSFPSVLLLWALKPALPVSIWILNPSRVYVVKGTLEEWRKVSPNSGQDFLCSLLVCDLFSYLLSTIPHLFSWCRSWILFLMYETSKHLAVTRECDFLWLLHFLKLLFCKQFLVFCVWFSFKYFTVKIKPGVFKRK